MLPQLARVGARATPAVRLVTRSAPSRSVSTAAASYSDRLHGFDKPTVWHEFTPLAIEHGAMNLGQGFPDWQAPQFIKDACVEAINANHNQYTRSGGHPELVAAVANTYSEEFGRDIDPLTEVTVTSGAAEGLFNAVQALIEPGDEVIIMEPFFDTYPATVQMAGGIPKFVTLTPPESGSGATAGGFTLDLAEVEAAVTPKTKALLLNTPHNPTGKVFTSAELEGLADIARRHDLVVITDEVYERINFTDEGQQRISNLPGMWERTVVLTSAAKTFSVTGWKIGWCIGPKDIINRIMIVNQWVRFCISTPHQVAVAKALEIAKQPYEGHATYYDYVNSLYADKVKLLSEGLEAANLAPVAPEGTFFVFADTSKLDIPDKYLNDSTPACPAMTRDWAAARYLTIEAGVTAIPPSAFVTPDSQHLYGNFLRFAFCKEDESIVEANRRLKAFVDGL